MKFSVFQISRKGGREKNEDRMGYCYTRNSGLFLLADGMGGHPAGEIAAQIALQTIASAYQKETGSEIEDIQAFFKAAVMEAHHQILRYASEHHMLDTPRTTLVAAIVQGGFAHWVHCGDSRLYLVRAGELVVRTRDHSYLEQQQDAGRAGSLPPSVNRNVLYTCLGSPAKPVFDLAGPVPLEQGDKLLLCSDGLWGTLEESDIVRQLSQKPVSQSAPELTEKALLKAGSQSDNVTLLALEWESAGTPETNRGTISTEGIARGEFTSTLQPVGSVRNAEELDAAAVERSIAEIHEAIRRSVIRKP